MKLKHKRLFIPVINDVFGKHYPMDSAVQILPSEEYLTENETKSGEKEIEELVSDFLMKLGGEVYLLECQSYDDGAMAIRIAEYAFIVARQCARWEPGRATIPMPRFTVIYVKRTNQTPERTEITFDFPDGQTVNYDAANVMLEEFTKEDIVEKRLFPYVPFYIARYEKELSGGGSIERAVGDLEYFRDEMVRLHGEGELLDDELLDLKGFINTIITHITDGNQNEERLVSVMGGTVIETESEKLIRMGIRQGRNEGEAKMLIEMGQEYGLDNGAILERMQKKIGMSFEQAVDYLKKYGKPTV